MQMLMQTIHSWLEPLLTWLSLPTHSLSSIFAMSFLSATFLPLPAEPVVLGVIELRPDLFWPAIGVATLGNTLGGMLTWWMGLGAHSALNHWSQRVHHTASPDLATNPSATNLQPTYRTRIKNTAITWLHHMGPKACFFAWVPFIGDPLCALAGWMRLPLWPCAFYMLIGKGLRYWLYSAGFVWLAT
jgi:membrane protein YqaA with SNARE-associated domain